MKARRIEAKPSAEFTLTHEEMSLLFTFISTVGTNSGVKGSNVAHQFAMELAAMEARKVEP